MPSLQVSCRCLGRLACKRDRCSSSTRGRPRAWSSAPTSKVGRPRSLRALLCGVRWSVPSDCIIHHDKGWVVNGVKWSAYLIMMLWLIQASTPTWWALACVRARGRTSPPGRSFRPSRHGRSPAAEQRRRRRRQRRRWRRGRAGRNGMVGKKQHAVAAQSPTGGDGACTTRRSPMARRMHARAMRAPSTHTQRARCSSTRASEVRLTVHQ